MTRTPLACMFSTFSLLTACDVGDDSNKTGDRLAEAIEEDEIGLEQAIATARAEHPDGTVLEAELDLEHAQTVYDVKVLVGASEYEVHVATDSGDIVRDREEALDSEDAAEAEAAASLVQASPGWPAIIDAARSEVGGIAFEIEADADEDGSDGRLKVEVFADDVVYEVRVGVDGRVSSVEEHDDDSHDDDSDSEDD